MRNDNDQVINEVVSEAGLDDDRETYIQNTIDFLEQKTGLKNLGEFVRRNALHQHHNAG